MKISTKGRYVLRMLIDLAEHQGDGYIPLKEIAQRQGISKKYLEQIVPMLNKSDILRTNRGFQGGYRLAKSPEKYTVGDILRLTEGSLAPVACLDSGVVVANPVIEDMQVGMFRIGVAHDKVLRAGNLHTLHIRPCQVNHQLVRHPRVIIRMERERDMSDDPFDIGTGPALELEAAD